MMSDFCRFYPAYTVERIKRELSKVQFRTLLEKAYKRPYNYSVWVEPKKD